MRPWRAAPIERLAASEGADTAGLGGVVSREDQPRGDQTQATTPCGGWRRIETFTPDECAAPRCIGLFGCCFFATVVMY
jgi:hypothetical protein